MSTFEATLDEVAVFRDSIAAVSEMIDETELRAKETGIELVAADRAVVTVVDFFLHRNAFTSYQCDGEVTIGVNLVSLLQVLRRAVPGDVLSMKLEDNKLHVTLEGASTRRFTLPLIHVTREETPDLAKLEAGFSATVSVDSEVLNAGIEDAEMVADSTVFTLRKEQLHMKSEGDSSSAQLEIPQGESYKVLDANEPVRARYSLDYLKKIFKARKLSDHATLAMATDYPMKIQFEVPGKTRLSFILAPRVEE